MATLKKGSPKNKSVDAKNNEILKYYNDKFEDNNKKKNQPRVEVMQEFFPPMSKEALKKVKI